MEKINSFIKENYKLIIPIMLMILLFVVFFIYYQVSSKEVYTDTTDSFYQYFYDTKYEYEGVVTTNKKGEVTEFKSKDNTIELDSRPIYYKNSNKVILPKDMSVVMPTLSCAEYLSKGFSVITYKDGLYNLVTKNYNNKLNYYFFYDSNDLYFFIENVVLSYNGKEVKLTPFSYVVYNNRNDSLEYYDKNSDTYMSVSDIKGNVKVTSQYYTVVVSDDYIDYYGSEVLLTSGISNLNTIDMKD